MSEKLETYKLCLSDEVALGEIVDEVYVLRADLAAKDKCIATLEANNAKLRGLRSITIAKFRDLMRPDTWWVTDFTMEQIEHRITTLEADVAKLRDALKAVDEWRIYRTALSMESIDGFYPTSATDFDGLEDCYAAALLGADGEGDDGDEEAG